MSKAKASSHAGAVVIGGRDWFQNIFIELEKFWKVPIDAFLFSSKHLYIPSLLEDYSDVSMSASWRCGTCIYHFLCCTVESRTADRVGVEPMQNRTFLSRFLSIGARTIGGIRINHDQCASAPGRDVSDLWWLLKEVIFALAEPEP